MSTTHDPVPPPAAGRSVLFALGKLTSEMEQTRKSIEAVPGEIATYVTPLASRLGALEPRVAHLERGQWRLGGGIAVVGFLLSGIVVLVGGQVHFR